MPLVIHFITNKKISLGIVLESINYFGEMMKMYRAIFLFSFITALSCNESADIKKNYAPEIKSYNVFSKTINDTFVIDVTLPESYNEGSKLHYPVLYLTDGNWRREQHQKIHEMSRDQNVKEMIIVGIGYPSSYNFDKIRVRDFINNPGTFLDFIVQEIIPKIDSGYRTNGERTLWGSSFGGFFAVYSLLNYVEKTKGVFDNYIVASAAINEKTNFKGKLLNLIDVEKNLSSKTTELKANLFITVGQVEDEVRFINPFKQLVKILNDRKYKYFYIKSFVDPMKNHYTVWEPTLYEGVRLFFRK